MWKSPSVCARRISGGVDLVQPLEGVVHVGVLVDLPVRSLEVAVDEVDIGPRDNFPDPRVLVAIDDVRLGRALVVGGEEDFLHDVLYLFDRGNLPRQRLLSQVENAEHQTVRDLFAELASCLASPEDRRGDFLRVERNDYSIPLFDGQKHEIPLPRMRLAAMT